ARTLWLEVRASKLRAQAIYRRYGFVQVGLRRSYYPAPRNRREDALVMSLALGPGGDDGLV
ncbi:MAG TPA: ribosomal-protein-alanine N-acetyltransferase, partial [Burkholderiaceae bacterium]